MKVIKDILISWMRGYNHEKYWRRREKVVNPQNKTFILLKLYYLWYIKRVDSKWRCTFGTGLNEGAQFDSPPLMWHGPIGIVIGHNVHVGTNCRICQHVTIDQSSSPVIIGNNVFIGPGAFIRGGVKIGNNVRIGSNVSVVEDIPDNATVVNQKPRIILKDR